MKKTKLIFFSTLIVGAIGLIVVLAISRNQTKFKSSLAPAFQLIGKTPKVLNAVLTKIIPINETDEASYGVAIKARYLLRTDTTTADYQYLNQLMANLSKYSKKRFEYQVFVEPTSIPNAFAMPGGVIVITQGFLDLITSEDELVSVIGHEMGHIELDHCFSAVKYELLLKKVKMKTLGQIADFCVQFVARSSYSKTQENEADEYGYKMLLETKYNPLGMYKAFDHLFASNHDSTYDSSDQRGNILSDYFRSHPPSELRIEKFLQDGNAWWARNEGTSRYNGKRNFTERTSFFQVQYEEEWVRGLDGE